MVLAAGPLPPYWRVSKRAYFRSRHSLAIWTVRSAVRPSRAANAAAVPALSLISRPNSAICNRDAIPDKRDDERYIGQFRTRTTVDNGIRIVPDITGCTTSGITSSIYEFELLGFRDRLPGSMLNKSEHGELQLILPTGFEYDRSGAAMQDPDVRVT